MSKILVIGSINIDFVFETERIPVQGETIIGNSFEVFDGGKGANQAIAACRYGVDVDFIGAVGDDVFGKRCIDNLKENGVNTDKVVSINKTNTGVANIMINDADNRIIIVEGANLKVDKEIFDFNALITNEYQFVLIQSEIPVETIKQIIDICQEKKVKVIYNPAPFKDIGDYFLKVDYITPNKTEYEQLINSQSVDKLISNGVKIIKTCGEDGVQLITDKQEQNFLAPTVEVVDTTGAGDTFNGVLSACLANSISIQESIESAVKCASYSTTKLGAQSGMPIKGEIC